MKIAIPSMDGQSISAHFGRSRCFLVFDLDENGIRSREVRMNGQAHPDESHECALQHGAAHEHGQGSGQAHHHGHDHAGFARLLGDCKAILAGGMGGGARVALESAGIEVCLVNPDMTPEEAAMAFAKGSLRERKGATCGCHGKH